MAVDHVVALSGGWDSAACLVIACGVARRSGETVAALFVDYGQPYLRQEQKAVATLMERFPEVELVIYRFDDMDRNGRVFKDRNVRILTSCAGLLSAHGSRVVWFGSRCPLPIFDCYGDSNWWWARKVAARLGCRIRTPVTLWPKWLVRRAAGRGGVKECDVFSSEGYQYGKEPGQ